jgi:diguanylate cyclase (GGDEF)-like protein
LTDEPLVIPDTWKDARFADNPLVTDEPHIRFYAGHPIHSPSGLRVGTLCLIDSEPRHFSEEDRNALQDLASIVDQELGLLQRATIDELTGLYNRRGFFEIGNSILALCRRRGESATLIGIDLDGFKSVNDTYGHERGDQVLRIFGNLLRSHFRTSDVIARVGGDEFAVLCAGADSSGILQSLEVFQQEFRASDCGAANVGLAWSAGAAEFNPQSTDALTDLMKRADVKMYQAKLERKGAWRA